MNYIFHHLPKTGGKSIRVWLTDQLKDQAVEFGPRSRCGELPCQMFWKYVCGGKPRLLRPAKVLLGHYTFNELADAVGWESFQPITIIRHPAERLYSQWHHYRRTGSEVPSRFEGWVAQAAGVSICNCLFCFCDRQMNHHVVNPMMNFYASRSLKRGGGLGEAKLQLEKMMLFHTNALHKLAWMLAANLSIPLSAYKPANVSSMGKEVSPEHRELVARIHPLDMELYEWAMQRLEG